jgi:hypothetical protein
MIKLSEKEFPLHIYEDKLDIYTGKMLYKDLNQDKRAAFLKGLETGASLNGWVSVKEDLPKNELLTKKIEAIDEYGNVSIIFGKSLIIRRLQFTHWRRIVKPVTTPNDIV